MLRVIPWTVNFQNLPFLAITCEALISSPDITPMRRIWLVVVDVRDLDACASLTIIIGYMVVIMLAALICPQLPEASAAVFEDAIAAHTAYQKGHQDQNNHNFN